VLLTLFLALKQRKLGYAVVILIFAYSSVRMVRLVTPCGIIVLGILVSLLSEMDLKSELERLRPVVRRAAGAVVVIVVVTSLYSAITLARGFMLENRTSALRRPEQIVSYMQEQGLSGRIFNEYGIGGYLIYALSPDSTVYIDGRTGILYQPPHYRKFLDARNNPAVLVEEIQQYDISLALLETDRRAYSVMHEAGMLGLDFVDYGFSLFTRENPSFPIAGKLLGNPACWSESDKAQLEAEFTNAVFTLPGNSSLLPNLGFMNSFAQQSDQAKFLEDFAASATGNEMQVRFAAYHALSVGLPQTSADLFERIEIWDHREFLAAAMAHAGLKDWDKAEEIIDWLTMVQWPYVTDNDRILLYRILETIRRNQELSRVQDNYVDDLEDSINAMGVSASRLELEFGLLCST
jgi:hypothetical protein